MVVTSFTLVKLDPSHNELDLFEALMSALETQDEWVSRCKPRMKQCKEKNTSTIYVTHAGPPSLLMVTPWENLEAHKQWKRTQEHKQALKLMNKFIAPGYDSIASFHLVAAGKRAEIPQEVMGIQGFDVHRIVINERKRKVIGGRYKDLEQAMMKLKLGGHIWAGWKVEKSNGHEELVLLSSYHKAHMRLLMGQVGLPTKHFEAQYFRPLIR